MPHTEEHRLETALRNAAAAGNTQAAQRIAQEIRSRRADQGQPPVPPGSSAIAQEADPLASVPTEINNVPLTSEMRQAILSGRNIENPKERRILAARIAGRLAAQSEDDSFVDSLSRGQFGAGLRGFGAGLFGLGDIAAAGGTALGGLFEDDGLSFGEALEAQREFRRALEEDFPLTSGLAEIGGALTGGGAATAGVRAGGRAAGGRVGRGIEAATTLREGQRARNALRLAAAGGATGAITEGITEGDPVAGGAVGAAAGPIGAGLVRAAAIPARAVRDLLADPASKGLRALASRLNVEPDEIGRRFLEFQEVTGRTPAIADIANPQAVAELRDLIAERTGATTVAREAAERAARGRAPELAEQIAEGRVTTTATTRQAARDRLARQQFAEAERDTIVFDRDEVQDLLSDPDLRAALPRTLRRRVDTILEDVPEGEAAELTGLDVNDIRLALRDRARGATGADRVFGELADELEGIASAQSPAFRRAIDEFARRSREIEGVTAGRRALTQRTSEFIADVGQRDVPGRAGARVGARAELTDVAREGATQARRVARSLTEDSGLVERLRAVLPEREVNRLQQLGQVQSRAFENIERLAPGAVAQSNREIREAVSDAVNAAVLAGPGTSVASRTFAFGRILQRLRPSLSDRVVNNLAEDAFNPDRTEAVLQALRRANIPEDRILDLYVSAAAGIVAADN